MRLGLCCTFAKEDIKFKTATVTYLNKLKSKGEDWLAYLDNIVINNVNALTKAILFCRQNQIGSFRVNSNFLPCCTHKDVRYSIHDLPSSDEIYTKLEEIKQMIGRLNIRLSFHPDQFVVLNSPNDEIVQKSIEEIEYHTTLAKLIGADTINIHGGGGYGNKEEALKRFVKNFFRLSEDAQQFLTVENDDKIYSPSHLLPICKELSIPLVYDVHHHRCYKDNLTIEEASLSALATWNKEPLFHISSPINGWKEKHINRHHDYIDINDFPEVWFNINPLTIEVEAKAKELAVIQLSKDLINLKDR